MTAGGFLVAGVAIGFLFAIPRAAPPGRIDDLEVERGAQGGRSGHASVTAAAPFKPLYVGEPRYYVNSNLEQISDWLTKIIVGVG